MTEVVVDASIAIKWVVEEDGTAEALVLRGGKCIAPELLIPECANILWKKVVRRELVRQEAETAAALLARADVELHGMRGLLETATRYALQLGHPAYDCTYLALALDRGCSFVTADRGFVQVVSEKGTQEMRRAVAHLGST